MRRELEQEIENSLYIHRMLPLHPEKSLEAECMQKKVIGQKILWGGLGPVTVPEAGEIGSLSIGTEDGEEYVEITAPVCRRQWPKGAAPDGDYSNFGTAQIAFSFTGDSWEAYNRICFRVKPQVPGSSVVHLNLSLENDGEVKVPDVYAREGFTTWNLKNYVWNECCWEVEAVPRDCVKKLNLYVYLNGRDVSMGDELSYRFQNLRLERIENPEKVHGWECAENRIVLSSAGYMKKGEKVAVANIDSAEFTVEEQDTQRVVYRGKIETVVNSRGCFQKLDFSDVTKKGFYYIQAGTIKSQTFGIGMDLIEESAWRVMNFLYGERCGMPIAGKHGTCHRDITACHEGKLMSFSGGWHDAGDVSQQSLQTGEIVQEICELANHMRTKNTLLYQRLIEEARWGLDFVLSTRFGDGYRATSAGATRYTNGLLGDMDDICARVYNHAYENFMFSGIESFAYLTLKDEDKALAYGCLRAAQEDFQFAERRFAEHGVEAEQMFEHTYNSGLSQYYAAMVWASSLLYKSTGQLTYAKKAERWCDRLLACQDQGEAGLEFDGFFYRDEKKKHLVHFNHQSREHQFMQALVSICETQPQLQQKPRVEAAMKRYSQYLKSMMSYTQPYGMIPAGVYAMDEHLDTTVFPYMHVMCEYQQEKKHYLEQLRQGTPLNENFVVRNFPVWFSFRGNNVVLLSQGKAASMLGKYFKDEELLQIGREQLYWILGKNPFGQSMMYGAGSRYPSQYAIFPGESVGEIPVGIETKDDEDLPYWPQGNNATYKEVWTSAAGRFLLLAADYV